MMKGTFAFCRTKEAIRRLEDLDVVQNLFTEQYFKKESGKILVSIDCCRWEEHYPPMEIFPPYMEWRSVSNLHYYDDLKRHYTLDTLMYLTEDGKMVEEGDPAADFQKKRWFTGAFIQ